MVLDTTINYFVPLAPCGTSALLLARLSPIALRTSLSYCTIFYTIYFFISSLSSPLNNSLSPNGTLLSF